MSWLGKRDDFENGFLGGVLYTSAAGLALLGFLSTCAYVYHLDIQNQIQKYEHKIEELERKIEKCCPK